MLVAPIDPRGVAVEALVAPVGAEMVDQRSSQAAGAAADVQHPLARLQPAHLDEGVEERPGDDGIVLALDEQLLGRNEVLEAAMHSSLRC